MVTTIVVLPWPPSVNAYWRTVQGRTMVSKKGRIYKQAATRAVLAAGANKHLSGRLRVKLTAYPPDRRRRDIDNLQTRFAWWNFSVDAGTTNCWQASLFIFTDRWRRPWLNDDELATVRCH